MDVNFDFDSDATYCSFYENTRRPIKNKSESVVSSNSKVLEKIHNKVLLHFQGKILLGTIQVQQYMKQVSQMKLRRREDQCFVQKIQSDLFKINKLGQKFEGLVSLGRNSIVLDPIKNCALTEDFDNDPKITLFQGNSIPSIESIPMDLLTNDNFISVDSQKCDSEYISLHNNAAVEHCGNINIHKNINMKMDISGSDILNNIVTSSKPAFSEGSEVYIEDYSETPSMTVMERNIIDGNEINLSEINVANRSDHLSKKTNESLQFCINNINDNTQDENEFDFNNKLIISESFYGSGNVSSIKTREDAENILKNIVSDTNCSVDVSFNQKLQLTNSTNQYVSDNTKIGVYDENKTEKTIDSMENNGANCNINLTINSLLSEILKFNEYYFKNSNDEINSSTEDFIFSYQVQKFKSFEEHLTENVNLKTVSELSKLYEKCYNNNIKKLCYDIGTDKTSWHEVEEILSREEDMKSKVNHTLNELFEKVSLREQEINEKERKAKREKECLHDFDEVDRKKVNWRDLYNKNEARLEIISQEFKTLLKLEETTTVNEKVEDSFEGLDWRKL